jgi:hypothetical protein
VLEHFFPGTPVLTFQSVTTAIGAVAAEFDVVGIGIGEYRPNGAKALEAMLSDLPLFST